MNLIFAASLRCGIKIISMKTIDLNENISAVFLSSQNKLSD